MFDRFTDRVRNCFGLAREAALEWGHDVIGPEHILLGLLREGGGVASDALQDLGIAAGEVAEAVTGRLRRGEAGSTSAPLPFTPVAKRVLEKALEEASDLGCSCIGTEHLLLGLIEVPGTIAADALAEAGAEFGAVSVRIRELVKEPRPFRAGREETHRKLDAAIETLQTVRAAPRGGSESMFHRFPDRARKCMGLARLAAQEFSHDFIGAEHILLGLLAEQRCAAARVLADLGIDREAVAGRVRGRMRLGSTVVTKGQLPFTPEAKRALERAKEEADGLGDDHIGTEHLLLGLIGVPETTASDALAEARVTEEAVRACVGVRNDLGRRLDEALRLLKEVRERLGGGE